MKLFGGNHYCAARRTQQGIHLAPEEKSASGQIQCRTLYSALGLILLSCALFVGTTFAWFSDNSTGATAQIVGGKLSVALVFDTDSDNLSLDNIPMTRREDSNSDEGVWNPGETFETPLMHVVNTGDLPLEYKLVLDPADELKDAVTFKIVDQNDTTVNEVQLLAPADTKSAFSGPSFKIVGTMKSDDMSYSGTVSASPFRLSVIARQADVPDTEEWPTPCTAASHAAMLNPNSAKGAKSAKGTGSVPTGVTVGHDPDMPCRLIYVCSECGEVLKTEVDPQIHNNQAAELFARYAVGDVIVTEDLEGGGNTYKKTLACDYCHDTIGTLHVTTKTQEPDEETGQPAEIITSVSFDYSDTSVEGLYKDSPAQP